MSSDELTLFLLATVLLFFAHVARAMRWALLFPPRHLFIRFNLLFGLSTSYATNVIFPWGMGELFRVFFVSSRESISFSFVAATVVAERLVDLLVVALITLGLAYSFDMIDGRLLSIGIFMMLATLFGTILAALIRRSVLIRRIIWLVSSIFNDKIQFGIIEFCWSLGETIAGSVVLRLNYVWATLLMWSLYLSSYFVFALVIRMSFVDTYYDLLVNLSHPLITRIADEGRVQRSLFMLLLYSILPVLAVIVYGLMRQWSAIIRDLSTRIRYGGAIETHNLISNRFKLENEYKYFLSSHFSGDDKLLSSFGLLSMEDGVIHRLFNGGSEAITALVEVDQNLLIRKFAVGFAAEKLEAQAAWLKSNQDVSLPLVKLIGERHGSGYYRYDMPLVVPANDFYDVIHTSPIERSKSLLFSVIEHISAFHRRHEANEASREIVEAYLTEKVIKNAAQILDFATDLLLTPNYKINGKNYELTDWDCLKDLNWLSSQLCDLRISIIHGDLTIENIIVAPEQQAGLYIIDPNPDNIFNTPLIDLAKLMQSLHLGYEGLNRGRLCSMTDDGISLTITRSRAYSDLHDYFEKLIINQYGIDTLREVYFHELVNYLRLTPYKIRKNPTVGLTFLACTNILLERYLERSRNIK